MSARWKGEASWWAGTSRRARPLYAFAIAACALLAALHAAGLAQAAQAAWTERGVSAVLLVGAGMAIGVLAADFTTGLVHWAFDTYGDERTPLVGPTLIRSFRDHHRAPRAMSAHDGLQVNGQPAIAASGVFALLALPGARAVLQADPFAYAFAWSFLAVGALGNQLHQWSHRSDPPRPVGGLQRAGWILSARAHARHHGRGHDRAYCIATGWCNGVLDALGFWRALERILERATGIPPRAAPGARASSRGLESG